MKTAHDAANFLQDMFGFNDDNEAVRFYHAKAPYINQYLGSDWNKGGYRDYGDMHADVAGFYKHLRSLFVKKFGALPF